MRDLAIDALGQMDGAHAAPPENVSEKIGAAPRALENRVFCIEPAQRAACDVAYNRSQR
jgi:hypothetical protein